MRRKAIFFDIDGILCSWELKKNEFKRFVKKYEKICIPLMNDKRKEIYAMGKTRMLSYSCIPVSQKKAYGDGMMKTDLLRPS